MTDQVRRSGSHISLKIGMDLDEVKARYTLAVYRTHGNFCKARTAHILGISRTTARKLIREARKLPRLEPVLATENGGVDPGLFVNTNGIQWFGTAVELEDYEKRRAAGEFD